MVIKKIDKVQGFTLEKNAKANLILRIKLQKNGKILCAKARYSHHSKLYTFLVEKIEEASKWLVEDTFQLVTVEEFIELSVRDFPVPINHMKYIYPVINETKNKNANYFYTINSQVYYPDYIAFIKFLASKGFQLIKQFDDDDFCVFVKDELVITVGVDQNLGVEVLCEEDILELIYEFKKNLSSLKS